MMSLICEPGQRAPTTSSTIPSVGRLLLVNQARIADLVAGAGRLVLARSRRFAWPANTSANSQVRKECQHIIGG